MKPNLRLLSASLSALTLLAAAPAHAQECVGLPGGRGTLSLGFEGTDGASGQGASFSYQARGTNLQLQHRSLDAFAMEDHLTTTEAQAAVRLPRIRLPLCVTAGLQWTAYDFSTHESTQWTQTDPDYRIERHRIGGGYQRLRVPVGISLGREFEVGRGVSLVPYLQPTVVLESERLTPAGQAPQTRTALGLGVNGGLAVAKDWFVLRANLSNTSSSQYSLSPRNNFASVSLHLGVRF
jgi:hypothetical protein